MRVLTWLSGKVLPKKLMTKLVNKQIAKAPKVDCGIFAQEVKYQKQLTKTVEDAVNIKKEDKSPFLVRFQEISSCLEDDVEIVMDNTGKLLNLEDLLKG